MWVGREILKGYCVIEKQVLEVILKMYNDFLKPEINVDELNYQRHVQTDDLMTRFFIDRYR